MKVFHEFDEPLKAFAQTVNILGENVQVHVPAVLSTGFPAGAAHRLTISVSPGGPDDFAAIPFTLVAQFKPQGARRSRVWRGHPEPESSERLVVR